MSSFQKKKKKNTMMSKWTRINHFKIVSIDEENIHFNHNISVCIHCYDLKIFHELMFYITHFFEFTWKRIQIIIHVVNHELQIINNIIKKTFDDKFSEEINKCFVLIQGKNIGGDIGGFLRCCELIKIDDDLVSIIHTKTDDIWRRQMMNIFTKEGIYTSIKLFESIKSLGMIGSTFNIEHFRKKYNSQFSINKYYIPMIKEICDLINFPFNDSNLIQSYFVAGTIFMCKKDILNHIIQKNNLIYDLCLDFDKLYSMNEKRPKNKTYEHAMEIMFGYISFELKRNLVGIF
tara:strand:+ start:1518 stop:2387 length:870 start_codon:yes stop_codon:yes gene_type:complete